MINKNRPPPLAGSTRSRPPVAPPAADRRRRPRNGPPAPGPRTWPVSPRALPQGLRENMRNEGSIRENLGTWDKNMLINQENEKNQTNSGGKQRNLMKFGHSWDLGKNW